MGKARSRVYSTTPMSKVDGKLFSYKTNKKNTRVYTQLCDKCWNEFQFTQADVKDRVVKCPNCGKDVVFFAFNHDD